MNRFRTPDLAVHLTWGARASLTTSREAVLPGPERCTGPGVGQRLLKKHSYMEEKGQHAFKKVIRSERDDSSPHTLRRTVFHHTHARRGHVHFGATSPRQRGLSACCASRCAGVSGGD